MKYLYIAFDDNHVFDWYKCLSFYKMFELKCTFFISNINEYVESEWDMMKAFIKNGHVVGHHGTNHLRAGVCDLSLDDRKKLSKPVHKLNWNDFINNEIVNGIVKIEKELGIYPDHYSYPMGNHSDNSDDRLLELFKTLKVGGNGVYPVKDFPKIYGCVDFGKLPDQTYCGHEERALNIKDGEVFCCYMHKPIKFRLEWLANLNYKSINIEDLINENY